MSKKPAKRDKKRSRPADFSPAALLRPRLDGLWGNPAWPGHPDDDLFGDLDAVVKGIQPATFLPAMLKAYAAAPESARARLDQILPAWLTDRGYVAALREVVARRTSTAGDRELALAWLQAAGEDATTLPTEQEQDAFFDAYYYSDESQAVLVLLCYRDRRHTQVQGFSFLLDFNPPWDGAVKDIIAFPRRDPQSAIREFVDVWHRGEGAPGFRLASISAIEAKRRVLEALARNRQQNIRLPADLIASRENFLRFVLSLPDGPDTPLFTAADFDALSRMGTRPEDIMHFEQTIGRRVRMEDGKELLVMGGGLDEDEWEEDEAP